MRSARGATHIWRRSAARVARRETTPPAPRGATTTPFEPACASGESSRGPLLVQAHERVRASCAASHARPSPYA